MIIWWFVAWQVSIGWIPNRKHKTALGEFEDAKTHKWNLKTHKNHWDFQLVSEDMPIQHVCCFYNSCSDFPSFSLILFVAIAPFAIGEGRGCVLPGFLEEIFGVGQTHRTTTLQCALWRLPRVKWWTMWWTLCFCMLIHWYILYQVWTCCFVFDWMCCDDHRYVSIIQEMEVI